MAGMEGSFGGVSERAAFHAEGIRVRARYPAFAVLSWDTPRSRAGEVPLPDRTVWHYYMEWNCSCCQRQTPYRTVDSVLPYAVLPLHHPGEMFYVRLVSRGVAGGSTVALTSARTSFLAECDVDFPWLQPDALRCPALYDGLSLAAHGDACATSGLQRVRTSYEGLQTLESGLTVNAFTLHYGQCHAPLRTESALLLVAVSTGAPASGSPPMVTHCALWKRALAEELSVVLCGVGELGGAAALSGYAMAAALLASTQSKKDISDRLYCVAYGTARRCLGVAPGSLLEAACISGNTLFYSGIVAPSSFDSRESAPFPNTILSNGLPTQASPPPSSASPAGPRQECSSPSSGTSTQDGGLCGQTPLGVRAGPMLDGSSNELIMYGEASVAVPPSDCELFECLDVALHLALLKDVLFDGAVHKSCTDAWLDDGEIGESSLYGESGGVHELVPVVTAITHELEDGASSTLRLYIGGRNLQYNPHITCLTKPGDEPLLMAVVSHASDQLVCQASIIPGVYAACFAAVAVGAPPPASLTLSVFVRTDVGFTLYTGSSAALDAGTNSGGASDAADTPLAVPIPRVVSELLFMACRRQSSADSWVVGPPAGLVEAVLSSLPFWTFDSNGRDPKVVERNLASSKGARYLGQLVAAAEVAAFYQSKKPQNSFLAFMATVAAKVSNQNGGISGSFALEVPPLKEASYLHSSLKELVTSNATAIAAYLARMISWKRRLFTGLPNLDEDRYKIKLQELLTVFQECDLSREQPLVALELQLYSSLSTHLRAAVEGRQPARPSRESRHSPSGSRPLAHDFTVTEAFTFEEFFELTHMLFLPLAASSAPGRSSEALVVSEVAFLWSVCLLLQMRWEYTTSSQHIVAVTGCRGSGCSTAAAALTAVCSDLTAASCLAAGKGRPCMIAVKLVPESALVLLRELMCQGVAITVVVVAELPDVRGLAFSAITRSLYGSVVNAAKQRVHVVLAKADEHLAIASSGRPPTDAPALAATALECFVQAAGNSPGDFPITAAISLSPSLDCIRAALQAANSTVSDGDLASELLQQSVDKLRDLVLRDIERT